MHPSLLSFSHFKKVVKAYHWLHTKLTLFFTKAERVIHRPTFCTVTFFSFILVFRTAEIYSQWNFTSKIYCLPFFVQWIIMTWLLCTYTLSWPVFEGGKKVWSFHKIVALTSPDYDKQTPFLQAHKTQIHIFEAPTSVLASLSLHVNKAFFPFYVI